jgi:DNA invertase Pin-like site-specific DNA recombinase
MGMQKLELPIRAAVYLRISLDRTGLLEAPDRQREAIHKLLAERGWTTRPEEEYLDASISASSFSKKNRTAYLRMIEHMKDGRFEAVVVWDTDRLTRKPREIEDWIDFTQRLPVQLVSVLEHIDTGTEAGRLYLRVKGNFAAHESEHKSTRMRAAIEQSASRGRPHSGRRAFGWELDRITIIESEAIWVRYAVAKVIGGASLNSIARTLNQQNVRTTAGNPWRSGTVRATVCRASNAGVLMYKGDRMPVSRISPIISEKDWQLAVSVVDLHPTPLKGPAQGENWLGRIMSCGVCGLRMVSSRRRVGGVMQMRYGCESRVHSYKSTGNRAHSWVIAGLAENMVIRALIDCLALEDIKPIGNDSNGVRDIQRLIIEVERQRDEQTDLLNVRGVSRARVIERLGEIEDEVIALKKRRASLVIQSGHRDDVARFVALLTTPTLSEGSEGDSVHEEVRRWSPELREGLRAIVGAMFTITVNLAPTLPAIEVRLIE